jgi:hypothetical protein
MNLANKHYFCRKFNKRNRVETIYVGFFQNNSTNEMFKLHFEVREVTIYRFISYFLNMKFIRVHQHLNHIKC